MTGGSGERVGTRSGKGVGIRRSRLALVLAVFGGIPYGHANRRLQDEAERFQQEKVLRPEGVRSVDVIQRIVIGMDEAALKDELGEPDSIKVYDNSVPPVSRRSNPVLPHLW